MRRFIDAVAGLTVSKYRFASQLTGSVRSNGVGCMGRDCTMVRSSLSFTDLPVIVSMVLLRCVSVMRGCGDIVVVENIYNKEFQCKG